MVNLFVEIDESVEWLWTGRHDEKTRHHCQRNPWKGNSNKIYHEFEKQGARKMSAQPLNLTYSLKGIAPILHRFQRLHQLLLTNISLA